MGICIYTHGANYFASGDPPFEKSKQITGTQAGAALPQGQVSISWDLPRVHVCLVLFEAEKPSVVCRVDLSTHPQMHLSTETLPSLVPKHQARLALPKNAGQRTAS